MRKYGISSVSLAWHCLGKRGYKKLRPMLSDIGADGIQFLPMRGWPYSKTSEIDDLVISGEDAWNYETGRLAWIKGWTWASLRLLHLKLYPIPSPTYIDMFLFGKKYSPFFPNAIQVEHNPSIERAALEIKHPDINLTLEDYRRLARAGKKFVIDTEYFRREGGPSWRDLLRVIPWQQIVLIHLKFKNQNSDYYELLAFLRLNTKCPVILEIFPNRLSYEETVDKYSSLVKNAQIMLR